MTETALLHAKSRLGPMYSRLFSFLALGILVGCSSSGSVVVPTAPAQPQVEVKITPSAVTLIAGTSLAFSATVTGIANTAVTWKASSGSISIVGQFTAPSIAGTASITATSVADTSKTATATVTVVPTPPPATPTAEFVQASGQAQSAGTFRNSPIIGEPVAAQTSSVGTTEVRHGFDPH